MAQRVRVVLRAKRDKCEVKRELLVKAMRAKSHYEHMCAGRELEYLLLCIMQIEGD